MSAADLLDRARVVARLALKAGADASEAYVSRSEQLEIKIVNGLVERTTESRGAGCGLRVEKSQRNGFASTSDLSPRGIEALVAIALAIAERAPQDPDGCLPEAHGAPFPILELVDRDLPGITWERGVDLASRVESAALASDARVRPGEGSTFARGRGDVAVAGTRGIEAAYSGTRCALACAPVAVEGKERQRQVWHDARRFFSDLDAPEEVGRRAAERAVRMLGARSVAKCRAPVIFDPGEAARFWGGLVPALLGDSARRGISFLKDDLGRRIASNSVTLIDDPHVPRAPGSRPFDGEGLPTERLVLVDKGVLMRFLYDTRTARRAGARSTGSAQRGYADAPSPGANALQLAPGDSDPAEILRSAGRGLYVTHLMGFGVNLVTGDYSRGANGWWIEGGEFAFPVHEVTLSGNLRDLLPGVSIVGNDLVFRSAYSSPTFLMEGLVISGRGA